MKLPEPELKYRRMSPAGAQPTRYKILYRLDDTKPLALLAWIQGHVDTGWTVTGQFFNFGNRNFGLRREVAEACLNRVLHFSTKNEPKEHSMRELAEAAEALAILAKYNPEGFISGQADRVIVDNVPSPKAMGKTDRLRLDELGWKWGNWSGFEQNCWWYE